jgi:cytochrome b subunit of formate dehydrogenase
MERMRKMMAIKAIVSTLMLISFTVVSVTGLLLIKKMGGLSAVMSAPAGVMLHTVFGLLMIIVGIIHFLMNLPLFIKEWKALLGKPVDSPMGR